MIQIDFVAIDIPSPYTKITSFVSGDVVEHKNGIRYAYFGHSAGIRYIFSLYNINLYTTQCTDDNWKKVGTFKIVASIEKS